MPMNISQIKSGILDFQFDLHKKPELLHSQLA